MKEDERAAVSPMNGDERVEGERGRESSELNERRLNNRNKRTVRMKCKRYDIAQHVFEVRNWVVRSTPCVVLSCLRFAVCLRYYYYYYYNYYLFNYCYYYY